MWKTKTPSLREKHPPLPALLRRRILHGIRRLGRNVRDGAAVREEQDLDGDGEARVQGDDDDEQDARGLGVDGGDDGIAIRGRRKVSRVDMGEGKRRANVQVAEEEGGGEGEADADEGVVEGWEWDC